MKKIAKKSNSVIKVNKQSGIQFNDNLLAPITNITEINKIQHNSLQDLTP